MADANNTIRVGDVDTIFETTVKEAGVIVDISGATTLQMKFVKPSGATVTETAVLSSDGTDGKLRCVGLTGGVDMAGAWRRRAYIALPTWSGHASWHYFDVEP